MQKLLFINLLCCLAFETITQAQYKKYPTIGNIQRFDASLDQVLDTTASLEIIGQGFTWPEGPVWVKKEQFLLFSDVPNNVIYKWTEKDGVQNFLTPSGYTGTKYYSAEPGSNGLIINNKGNLVACEHGDRRISEMPLHHPEKKKTLAHLFEGKQLNSPNDIVQHSSGDYYFTDPPFGLPLRGEPELAKELPFQGIYKIDKKGKLTLQAKEMTRPNGLAFNPDETVLYVGQSDRNNLIWKAYPLDKQGNLGEGKIFFDATNMSRPDWKMPADGIKVDEKGNVWTIGPGGVLIINPQGKLLGRIETISFSSNCTFGEDGSTLFITSGNNLLRIKTKTKGVLFR